MNEKIVLLESVLGPSVPAHASNLSFHCPFCNHPKPKLNVSLDTGAWGCWVCGQSKDSQSRGRTVSRLFRKLGADQYKIEQSRLIWGNRGSEVVQQKALVSLPSEYKPLWIPSKTTFYAKAKNYLISSRKITELDIIKYRIGYCIEGRFSDRIIFPSYDIFGQLNFFSARSYLRDPKLKFLIPENIDKNIITYEDHINWTEPVILVESQLDAITIRRNAIPLNGKTIGGKLREAILERNVPKVILCFDGDAKDTLMEQSQYFIDNGVPVYRVDIPDGADPNSLGFETIWRYIDRASRINETQTFAFRLSNLLN